jgi:hypothetical protein
VDPFLARPSVIRATLAPKAWGWERWLTSTRPEGPAKIGAGDLTLADGIAAHPEALGKWTRRLFGDTKPIFSKLIHTSFPSRVHVGFRRSVERGQFLAWLAREQDLLRTWLAALRIPDERAFGEYQSLYSAWATLQALAGWSIDDDQTTAARLAVYLDSALDVRQWLAEVRANRARIVDTLNDIDLKREAGNLLLTGAGTVHAIYGLSHQTHPLDPSRPALEELFSVLGDRARRGDSDAELEKVIDRACLSELRGKASAPPKNEAWLPRAVDGEDVLVEPQQTSDTTLSFADFYTPFTWGEGGPRFRKGAPKAGLSQGELAAYLAEVDFNVAPVSAFRRSPVALAGQATKEGALHCLLDEPTRWPFFTAFELELTGQVRLAPPPGVFQELVVTRGRVVLSDASGKIGELTSSVSGFVPATLEGSYALSALEGAHSSVLVFAVPGARGGAPRWIDSSAQNG